MKRDVIIPFSEFKTHLLSCDKDAEAILRKLFITSKPYSDDLKRLLVINTEDCLDNKTSKVYNQTINEMSLAKLKEEGYIRMVPKFNIPEHEEVKSYIILSFDNFYGTNNDQFRSCTISFDIICHTDYWDLGDFRLRPLKIAGYIDGILNGARLSGIGELEFAGLKELLLDETFSGYTLMYRAVHGTDDFLPEFQNNAE